MGFAELIDISRWSAGDVALLGVALAIGLTVVGYVIAVAWRSFIDPRRKG